MGKPFYNYEPGQLLRRMVDGALATYLGPPNGPWEKLSNYGVVRFAKPMRFFGSDFNVDLHAWKPIDMIAALGGLA